MPTEQIDIEASHWLARLDAGDDTRELLAAVEAWRNADPRHEAAFVRLQAGWKRLDRLRALRPAAVSAAGEVDWVPLLPMQTASRAARRGPLAIAAGLAVAGGIAWTASTLLPRPVYTTAVGGFERVQLDDSSVVELNTDTKVRAGFSSTVRRVELLKGEASFSVTPDARRPFVVVAGDMAIRAVGTEFNVRRNENGTVDVIVKEGRVAVGRTEALAASGPVPVRSVSTPVLSAGESVSVVGGHMQVRSLSPAETEREVAWQSGMLLFKDDTLDAVVAEFNRYNQRQLEVLDPALASLRIGGYFRATNLDAFLKVLEKDFDIRVTVTHDRIALRPPPGVE